MNFTSLDEDITVVEDLDFDLTCNALATCENEAEWLLIKTCCDQDFLVCEFHKTILSLLASLMGLRCHACGFSWDAGERVLEWRKL